ncbi:MAG: 3-dehydroquinate synthase II [Candidatus Bathyarchaeota archaeon]|nr:3-dehydroquinate synthase II [Candidatus Bathyarchaeota archaeon]
MRELWVKVDPSLNKDDKERLINATHSIVSAYMVESGDVELARRNDAKTIVTASADGDILLMENIDEVAEAKNEGKTTCVTVTVQSKEDEKRIVNLAGAEADYIVAKCQDWKVIPLENLIAQIHGRSVLLALASDPQEAKLVLETLEIGADGVVAEIPDADEIVKIHDAIRGIDVVEEIALHPTEVVKVKPLGSGARVCVDTCDLMKDGEGMLVGCQSSGAFLVQAEVHETEFLAPRPFRVNAGSVAMYVVVPGGRTRYLSELKAGDEILIVDRHGRSRVTNICRVKIEWRPLILIEAEHENKSLKMILQNAETIRVVTEGGTKSVADLAEGDKVLVHIEEGGRHLGTLVKEEKVIER